MEAEELFLDVCRAGDPAAALRGMGDGELRLVLGHCGREMTENNVAGVVLGHAVGEVLRRFMKTKGGTDV